MYNNIATITNFDLITIPTFLLIMTIFSIYYVEKYKNRDDILKIPSEFEDGNAIKLGSRKMVLPIQTDPKRTIKIIMKTDNAEEPVSFRSTADEDGFILLHLYFEDFEKVEVFICLDKKEEDLNNFDKKITFDLPDKNNYDYKVEYIKKSVTDSCTSSVVASTSITPRYDQDNLHIFFNTNHKLDEHLKEFISFSLMDYNYYFSLIKEINSITSNKYYLYYNDEKIGYTENDNIVYIN